MKSSKILFLLIGILIAQIALASHSTAGSWVNKAIALQDQIGSAAPINATNQLGTHNSTISSFYVSGGNCNSPLHAAFTTLACRDPNQLISLTNQLNQGIRHLELDVIQKNTTMYLCHFHIKNSSNTTKGGIEHILDAVLCPTKALVDGNKISYLDHAFNEINSWLNHNPNTLIYLYRVLPVSMFESY